MDPSRSHPPNATEHDVSIPDASPKPLPVPTSPSVPLREDEKGSGDARGGGGGEGGDGGGGDGESGEVVGKRTDYISWDDYFMSVAFLSAMRSKDPNTQVGACIVDTMNRIVGIGYNGFPRGCADDALPWARHAESPLDTKYLYVCHAEANAILNRNAADLRGSRMYVALFPCNECSKLIIQSGIEEVVFTSDKYHETPSMTASRRMFDLAGVRYRQHTPRDPCISIHFAPKPPAEAEKGE